MRILENTTMSVAAIVKESAIRYADNVAIAFAGEETSYRELWEQVCSFAGALRDLGVGPDAPVAIMLPTVPDFARCYYGVLALGAVVVPIHALLKASEIEHILRDSGAELLLCDGALLAQGAEGARLAGIPVIAVNGDDGTARATLTQLAVVAEAVDTYVPRNPGDTATILYTSGTTGKPKGAQSSHLAIIEQTSTLLLGTFDVRSNDVVLACLPLFHSFGQTCALNTSLRAGAQIVMLPRIDAETALRVRCDSGCTIFMGVPTMFIGLVEAAKRSPARPQLRYGVSGGASLPLAVMERFRDEFGTDIHEGYGLTETAPVASFNDVGIPPRPGSVGRPIWGVEIEIAQPDVEGAIELMPRGELGEIVIRGHNIMQGYLNLPAETAEAIVDGWFRSGDLGRIDDEGYVWVVDRKKDMILRNGFNVYPREVEEVLMAHPAVSSVAVFGVAHETHGQEIMAAVVLAEGSAVEVDEIVEYAKARLAAYKYPRVISIVTALPLGPSGKVLKRELTAEHERLHARA